jgi:hypothetical protein
LELCCRSEFFTSAGIAVWVERSRSALGPRRTELCGFPDRCRHRRVLNPPAPSSLRLATSFRVLPGGAASPLLGENHPPVVSSSSALPARETHWPRVCLTQYVASSGFRTLLTPCLSPCLPALFHAGCALEVFPSELSPPSGAPTPLTRPVALMPLVAGDSCLIRALRSLDFRALLPAGVRCDLPSF